MRIRTAFPNRLRLAICLLVVGLVAASCGDDKSAESSSSSGSAVAGITSSTVTAAPKKGGELTLLVPQEIPSLDPILNNASASTGGSQAYALFGYIARLENTTGKLELGTAQSLEPSVDARTWTLKLKPNVKFSDGTVYDAAAVKFNWDRAIDPKNASVQASAFAGLDSLTVTDPLTLTIKFKDPTANFGYVIARRLPAIGSPKAIQEKGTAFGISPVGAGPFTLESWTKDDKMVLVRNPTYYESDKGLPNLDKLIIRPIPDEDQRFNTFNQGQAGILYTSGSAPIVKVKASGKSFAEFSGSGGVLVDFNQTAKPFSDIRARKAFIMSVDLDALNNVVSQGGAKMATTGMMAKNHPLYADAPWTKFDCNGAKTLWAQLAAENGNKPIEFKIGGFSPADPEFFLAAITQCSGGNAKATIDLPAASAAVQNVLGKKYDSHVWGMSVVYDPTAILFQLLCNNEQNSTGYCNPEYDTAFKATAATTDLAKQKVSWAAAQQVIAKDAPVFFYRYPNAVAAYQSNVVGVRIHEEGILQSESLSLK